MSIKHLIKKIGSDVRVHVLSIIKHPELTRIGNSVAIDNGVTISTKLEIGNYVHIAPYVCTIGGKDSKVILKDFSFVAAGTKIVAGSEDYTGKGLVGPTIPADYREITYSTVTFEKFSGCGVNATIMPNVTMAEGSILGANSLLTKNTEPWTIYVGSPAKPVAKRDKTLILEYSEQLQKNNN